MLYPPFCFKARDERAVPCPATDTELLCTREARLHDEPSIAKKGQVNHEQSVEMQKATKEKMKAVMRH